MALRKGSRNGTAVAPGETPAPPAPRLDAEGRPAAEQDVEELLPEIPGDIPRTKDGKKPRIRVGTTPKFKTYRRASKYADVIEDKYNIGQWRERAVAFGASRSPELVAEGQMILRFENKGESDADKAEHKELRAQWQRISNDMIAVARTDQRARRGTALHKLAEYADQGVDLSYLDPLTRQAIDQWRRIMERFEIIGTEQFVVVDELEVGGSYDRLARPLGPMYARNANGERELRLTPDDVVILDLKSGASSEYWAAGYCGQQWIYANGTPYVHVTDEQAAAGDDGRRPWPGGVEVHKRWALIPHVPLERPADAGLMWVDLDEGRRDVEVATDLYDRRRKHDRFADAELPEIEVPRSGLVVPQVETAEARALAAFDAKAAELVARAKGDDLARAIANAVDMAALGVLFETAGDEWTPEHAALASARADALSGVSS